MFIDDEERLSDIYSRPRDRVTDESEMFQGVNIEEDKDSIVLDMAEPRKVGPSVRDSSQEVALSPEDIEKKRKKKRLITFIILGIIDLAFLGYIIYLVITIFMGLAQG